MTVAVKYPHIEKPADGGPAHLERVPRTRVAMIVMDFLAHGWSPDEIKRQYPYLQMGEIHSAFAYYYDNKEEIEREIEEELREVDALRAQAKESPVQKRLRALKDSR